MVPIFYAKALDGKLQFVKQAEFRHYLKTLQGEVQVVISKRKKIRSSSENAYYWGVIVKMVSDEVGIIPDEAHELLKYLFLKTVIYANRKRYEIASSTASLTTSKFEEYTERCRQWASQELNVYIPLPGEIQIDLN
jgi:hypothetical protein